MVDPRKVVSRYHTAADRYENDKRLVEREVEKLLRNNAADADWKIKYTDWEDDGDFTGVLEEKDSNPISFRLSVYIPDKDDEGDYDFELEVDEPWNAHPSIGSALEKQLKRRPRKFDNAKEVIDFLRKNLDVDFAVREPAW